MGACSRTLAWRELKGDSFAAKFPLFFPNSLCLLACKTSSSPFPFHPLLTSITEIKCSICS